MALSSTFLNPLVTSSVSFNHRPKITSGRKGLRVNCAAVETEEGVVQTTSGAAPAATNGAVATNGVAAPTPAEKSPCTPPHLSTVLVNHHADWDTFKATSTPIYQTATFKMKSAKGFGKYYYSRSTNPTRDTLESLLAKLDNADYAYCFSSGMSALTAVFELVENGDDIMTVEDIYGGSYNFINNLMARKEGIKVRNVDTSNIDNVKQAMEKYNIKLIWLETPSNPQLKISDIQEIAKIAKEHEAILFIDNSVMSPVLSNPLDLGADIVMHSATKFVAGNSTCMAGSLATNDQELADKIKSYRNATGCGLSPFDSWICLEGIKTMDLRVMKKQENAQKIATFLAKHPKVKKVNYPGLSSHRGHDLHKKQSNGPGSVISFTTDSPQLSEHVTEKTKYFGMTVSFGGVGSSVCLPWYTSHGNIPGQKKLRMGITKDLVRISVGIENHEDLIKDLETAFLTFDPCS